MKSLEKLMLRLYLCFIILLLNAACSGGREVKSTQNTELNPPRNTSTGVNIKHYIVYADGTALDTKTGLMWMRCMLGQHWDGQTCKGEPEGYSWLDTKEIRHDFAGYSDWRVPWIDELKTLVYCSDGKPAHFDVSFCEGRNYKKPTLVQNVFPSSSYEKVWSRSESKDASTAALQYNHRHLNSHLFEFTKSAFYVNFFTGTTFEHMNVINHVYVRLVRKN